VGEVRTGLVSYEGCACSDGGNFYNSEAVRIATLVVNLVLEVVHLMSKGFLILSLFSWWDARIHKKLVWWWSNVLQC